MGSQANQSVSNRRKNIEFSVSTLWIFRMARSDHMWFALAPMDHIWSERAIQKIHKKLTENLMFLERFLTLWFAWKPMHHIWSERAIRKLHKNLTKNLMCDSYFWHSDSIERRWITYDQNVPSEKSIKSSLNTLCFWVNFWHSDSFEGPWITYRTYHPKIHKKFTENLMFEGYFWHSDLIEHPSFF